MFANLKYLPENYRRRYCVYMTLLLLTLLLLAWNRPGTQVTIGVLLVFYLVDVFLLSRSKEKVLVPMLVDLFIYCCWLVILFPFH